jgi:hypothetical protein
MSIGLAGCATDSGGFGRPKVITPQTFACSDGQYAKVKVYSPEEAVMGFHNKQYEMKRVSSASGAKYAGQGAEFWSKSISAMITVDDQVFSCNTVPADASGEEDLTLPGDAMVPMPPPEVYTLTPIPPMKPVAPASYQ